MGAQLSQKTGELQAANDDRLCALIDFTQHLASERDLPALLDGVCRRSRKLIGASQALIAIYHNGRNYWQYFLCSGLAPEISQQLVPMSPDSGALGTLLKERTSLRLTSPEVQQNTGLPAQYPAVTSLLAARVASPSRTYGWLCLTNKVGAPGFSEEDERHAVTVASLTGRVYEKGSLYKEIEARARELEREIDELRTLNTELERRVVDRTAQLDAANKELEAFSYSVSHDLTAPLRRVDGFSELLREELGDALNENACAYLERIQSGAHHMAQLIQDLLGLSRVGRLELLPNEVDLTDLANRIAANLQGEAPERQVQFSIAPGLMAHGDARLLHILLENLLGNAWKYTGKHTTARIELAATELDGEAVYLVRDDGAGFDMAYAEKLFAPFQRLHGETEFEGTGIGLATVHRIIQRHGGRIWGEGIPDHGATFYFTLPASEGTGAVPGDEGRSKT